jgi:aquaporin Z
MPTTGGWQARAATVREHQPMTHPAGPTSGAPGGAPADSAVGARPGRAGAPQAAAVGQRPRSGFHPVEWACELAGTALLLLGGLSAVCLDFGPNSPVARVVPDHSARLLLTGLMFAGTGSLVAISPLGRRSGAHLNPVVTLAFWAQHRVHIHDVGGYLIAQFIGAVLGAGLVRLLWGGTASGLNDGATLPGGGFGAGEAALLEAGMTACLVLMLLMFTSSHRLAPWTPMGNWIVVAVLVWQGATYTGTSLNPARSFGPALLASLFGSYWAYVVGPLLGGAIATGIFALFRDRVTLTAKLFHDPRYRSSLGSLLPVRPTSRPATSPRPRPAGH